MSFLQIWRLSVSQRFVRRKKSSRALEELSDRWDDDASWNRMNLSLSVKRNIGLNRCHHYHRLYCNATTIKIQKLKSRLRRFELFFSIEQRKARFCKLNGKKVEKVIFVLNFGADSFLFHSPPLFWFQSLFAIGGSAFILNAENSISYFMTILSRPSSFSYVIPLSYSLPL